MKEIRMLSVKCKWLLVVGFVICLVGVGIVHANGIYKAWPGYEALPQIPVQRALIVYRDGLETLVVESTYETSSPEVAWILPLPTEPTEISKGEPGMLLSVSMGLRAKVITNGAKGNAAIAFWCIALLVIIADDLILRYRKNSRRPFSDIFMLTLALFLLWAAMLMPSLASLSTAALKSNSLTASVLSTARVGRYEVTVLRCDKSSNLSDWLATNGMQGLSEDDAVVFDDYIKRGWCFAIARLQREKGGVATPHPLEVTFPTKQAVFPMKATGLAGSETLVELMVVSDQQAVANGFKCIVSDQYQQKEYSPDNELIASYYRGSHTLTNVAHPDAGPYLWEGCTVTKLTATLNPQQMDRDVTLGFKELDPYQKHWITPMVRNGRVIRVLLVGLLLILVIIWSPWLLKPQRLGRVTVVTIILIGLCTSGYAIRAYINQPVYKGEVKYHGGFITQRRVIQYQSLFEQYNQPDLLPTVNEQTFEKYCDWIIEKEEYTREYLSQNLFTNEPMRFERSPGNYSSRVVDGQEYLCFYDIDGMEYRVKLPGSGDTEMMDE